MYDNSGSDQDHILLKRSSWMPSPVKKAPFMFRARTIRKGSTSSNVTGSSQPTTEMEIVDTYRGKRKPEDLLQPRRVKTLISRLKFLLVHQLIPQAVILALPFTHIRMQFSLLRCT